MPAARQRSRSSFRARAVKAMTGRCPPVARSAPPDRPHDLEAVELRHVDVQEQEVEGRFDRQVQRLPAVGRHPHGVTPPAQQPLQVPRVELAVLGHQDAQRCRGGGRHRRPVQHVRRPGDDSLRGDAAAARTAP